MKDFFFTIVGIKTTMLIKCYTIQQYYDQDIQYCQINKLLIIAGIKAGIVP